MKPIMFITVSDAVDLWDLKVSETNICLGIYVTR